MTEGKELNVAIVGGGPGCKAIMEMIFAKKLSQLKMILVGVASTHQDSVGYRYAREMGVYTTTDYKNLYALPHLDMIIEVTGRQEIANEIFRTKPEHVRLMGNVAARLFWDVFQIEENSIADREKAENELQESARKLKIAYEQSVIYGQQLNKEIADRKKTEAELRESQERYYTVLEASPDPVVVYDVDGKVIYTSPAFTRVFGWAPGEIVGMRLHYVPEQNWSETKVMIDRVKEGRSFSGQESRRLTKEGKVIDVSISAASYLNRDGTPVGSVHILRDITHRKLVEEALKKAHDELELRVEERTAALAQTTERLTDELAKRKQVEEALRFAHKELAIEADNLQAANEELSQYAYVVSHDLQSPLRAIRNYSDFLREDLGGRLETDQKTYLDGLNLAVQQGEELVGDLLEFSRVGKRSGPIEPIDMALFFQEFMRSIDLPENIEMIIADDMPTLRLGRTLLRQVFQDLIKNAIKFNDAPTKRVEIGWSPAGDDYCEFFVKDNGIGIDPRYHEQIFAMFHRLHSRQEYEGTGLGLAIVKKAANKLYGSVRLESEAGKGSTFFISLPKKQRER
jgi:PAS domain S-box-containing protein